jgi:hypothetical protein
MDCFYLPVSGAPDGPVCFEATPLTRGPWHPDLQHGGPPSALLAGALAGFEGEATYALARIRCTFHKAVPIAPLRVEVGLEHGGRTTQRLEARLFHRDTCVLSATGLRIRRAEVDACTPAEAAWPSPESVDAFVFPFFEVAVGYHQAVDLRCVGGVFGTTPVQFWARPRVPLVAGRSTRPEARVVLLADAQSGMGLPLPPATHTFVNPDLDVAFARTPRGEWTGLDIRSIAGPEGAGLSTSLLRDADGLFGQASQSLVTASR